MVKTFPDKWIRKAIFDKLNNIVVDSETIPCFDSRTTGPDIPNHYILMTTQTAFVEKQNKCEDFWESTILLDVFTTYLRPGNPGSRLLVDNIMDKVRDETNDLVLDLSSSLEIITQLQAFPSDITTITNSENIFRKFLRLTLLIK